MICALVGLVLVVQVVAVGTPLAATRNARAAAPPPDLRIGFLQTIDSLNPFQGVNDPSYLLYGLLYDYPYAFDQDGNWVSNLITSSSCANKDCSIWNYTVRQGVYWNDPQNPSVHTQMTAGDVAFTWNYDSQNLSWVWAYEPYFNQVVQCSQVPAGAPCGAVLPPGHPWNVTVYFNRPFAAGEDLFGPIVQEAQWQGIKPSQNAGYNNADPIGTGPFIADPNIYAEFQALPTVPLHVMKNPSYHPIGSLSPTININNIYLYEFTDVTQLTLAIERGDIDLAQFTTSTIGPLKNQPNIQVQAALQAIQEWNEIGISQCDTSHAIATNNNARFDTRVRQALAKATNKDYIVKNIYDGQGLRGDTLISPITPNWWYDPVAGGNNLTFDINAAKAILDADGWTGTWSDSTGTYRSNPNAITVSYQSGATSNYQVENLTNTSIVIKANTHLSFVIAVRPPAEFPEEYTTAQYLQAQWAQIGVKITILQESTENALQTDVYKCNVDMYIWYWSADPDPNYMLSMESSWTLDGWNDNYWVNTTYNRLYLKQLADLNVTQREIDAKAAQSIQYEQASYIIYIFPYGEWAMRTDLWQGWGDWAAHPYRQMNAYWGANPLFFDLNCPTCGAQTDLPPTPPVINYPTYSSWDTGVNLTLTATSSDPEVTNGLNFTWAWGDGTFNTTTTTAANPTTTASHYWMTPGNYTVTVSVNDGHNPSVPTNTPIYVNVTAPLVIKGWLAGIVRDTTGAPLSGAVVTTTPGNRVSSTTGATGAYNITLAPGSYSATATAPFFFDQTKGPVSIAANVTTALDFNLLSSKGWITGTVTNSQNGAAISGAAILVTDKAPPYVQVSGSTDSNGHFNVSVEPGDFTVNATASGYYKATQNATVTAAHETAITIKMDPLPGQQTDLTPLIYGSIAVIAIVAVVAVALIMMRRRKKKEEEEGKIQLPPKT